MNFYSITAFVVGLTMTLISIILLFFKGRTK